MSAMDLIHFSDSRVVAVEARTQGVDGSAIYKPAGFWVSDEAAEQSWSRWCEDEEFRDTSKQVAHRVELRDDHSVLLLTSKAEVREFDAEYANGHRFGEIRWADVASTYDGVIITPYQWALRLDLSWYYTWDCASGCIWSPRAVASVTQLVAAKEQSNG